MWAYNSTVRLTDRTGIEPFDAAGSAEGGWQGDKAFEQVKRDSELIRQELERI